MSIDLTQMSTAEKRVLLAQRLAKTRGERRFPCRSLSSDCGSSNNWCPAVPITFPRPCA